MAGVEEDLSEEGIIGLALKGTASYIRKQLRGFKGCQV